MTSFSYQAAMLEVSKNEFKCRICKIFAKAMRGPTYFDWHISYTHNSLQAYVRLRRHTAATQYISNMASVTCRQNDVDVAMTTRQHSRANWNAQ